MLNLNKLLYGPKEEKIFCNCIQPTKEQHDFLVKCKNDIRDFLRPRIEYVTMTTLGMPRTVEPRFRTQGSWSYNTCIEPAFLPPQEMDWDFGVYLPVSVWEDNGPPHEMAKKYFDLVEGLLRDLCNKKGWKLNSDKDTCIRVQVANWAHIDIPLYAVPEDKFTQIIEKAAMSSSSRTAIHENASFSFDSESLGELPGQSWEELDEIVMATRTGEWKASDPETVSRWFKDCILEHGEQLRRVNRYLKAWRDFHWRDGGGPTSIAIMIAVGQTFEPQLNRDDLALEKAAKCLAQAITREIREPAIDNGVEDFNRLNDNEKYLAEAKAYDLVSTLLKVRFYPGHLKPQVIQSLQQEFGTRIPDRPELIEIDNDPELVRRVVAQQVPSPVVLATTAG